MLPRHHIYRNLDRSRGETISPPDDHGSAKTKRSTRKALHKSVSAGAAHVMNSSNEDSHGKNHIPSQSQL